MTGSISHIYGADRYLIATGNWNNPAVWAASSGGTGGAGFPVAGDNVFIERGFTITVNIPNAQCSSLQLGGTTIASSPGTLTFAASGSPSLEVLGNIQLGASGNTTRVGTITFVSGSTLLASSITLGNPAASRGVITMTAGATLNTGSFIVNTTTTPSTWTPSTGTVNITATNTLPSSLVTSFFQFKYKFGYNYFGFSVNNKWSTSSQ
ncbi:MAG: hypothetical protein RSF34_16065 [Flavobacterium sp.]|uniref:hypothetical protein n=1 Tax=Flavobacterium sp. TaxID=239 RepID=UPI002FC8466E